MKSRRFSDSNNVARARSCYVEIEDEKDNAEVLSKRTKRLLSSVIHALLLLSLTSLVDQPKSVNAADLIEFAAGKVNDNILESNGIGKSEASLSDALNQPNNHQQKLDLSRDIERANDLTEIIRSEEDDELLVDLDLMNEEDILINDDYFDESEYKEYENSAPDPMADGILIVVAVDGTIAGLSKLTGEMMWKRSSNKSYSEKNSRRTGHMTVQSSPESESENSSSAQMYTLEPLVYTTTTAENSRNENWRTVAVPSILDGKVYLTASDITVTTTAKELVARSPFADRRGRIYTGTSVSSTIALDSKTGEIIQVIKGSESFESKNKSNKLNEQGDEIERDVLWFGRVDYSVTISEPNSGDVDVHFRTSELMSSTQMILRNSHEDQKVISGDSSLHDQKVPVQFIPPEKEKGELSVETSRSLAEQQGSYHRKLPYESQPELKIKNSVVVTPNGYIAYLDRSSDEILWVADENFDSPVAFCMDSVTGMACNLASVPDAVRSDSSPDYVSREMKRQLSMLSGDDDSSYSDGIHDNLNQHVGDDSRRDGASVEPTTIVSSLPGSGQLFAMPLRATHPSNFHTNKNHRRSSAVAHSRQPVIERADFGLHGSPGHVQHADYLHGSNQDRLNEATALARHRRKTCCHDTNDVEGCLCSDSESIPDIETKATERQNYFLSDLFWPAKERIQSDHRTFLTDSALEGKVSSAVVPFFDYDDYVRLLLDKHAQIADHEYNGLKIETIPKSQKPPNLLRILGSWLPPTIALIFVVSFELGRRKRQKEIDDLNQTNTYRESQNEQGKLPGPRRIQVCEDVVLGYGGHGTIVYKGLLEGRQVAVKRMLTTYNASADREISLLIESDGHPNVVRYFLKEVHGEFVYLALELCDLSLHDLINVINTSNERKANELANCDQKHHYQVPKALKDILLQIASGVEHLHRLRIVHRDLKPANILLADIRKAKSGQRDGAVGDTVLECFENGQYVAKISDMGLGKQLLGQSSYGASFLNGSSLRGGQSSVVGAKGTVGWQAPEVMALRATSETSLAKFDGSTGNSEISDSPMPSDSILQNSRTSRSVDIFSLGCVFYSTLVPGSHPFGDWYEREANIMHNRSNLSALQEVSPEGFDLVEAMLQRNPLIRPSAKDICCHPFFWTSEQKLLFLCDFSDRIEIDAANPNYELIAPLNATFLSVERNAIHVIGCSWSQLLDDELVNNVQRFRTYDTSSVRDLLRLIRNKHHHFDELSTGLKSVIGSSSSGLMTYFERSFPKLFIHCYNVCRDVLCTDDVLAKRYSIKLAEKQHKMHPIVTLSSVSDSDDEFQASTTNGEGVLKSRENQRYDPSACSELLNNQSIHAQSCFSENMQPQLQPIVEEVVHDVGEDLKSIKPSINFIGDTKDNALIIWQGSSAARTLNCQGWLRSDEEWILKDEHVARKRDLNIQQLEDSKFRTRLCNHWDLSYGSSCSMRKKNKCIFAHGPVELRVKDGKRNRWGKLVDSEGNCKNPCHSGGEDTYGAARSIESERKDEGKWNANKNQVKGKKNHTKKPKAK